MLIYVFIILMKGGNMINKCPICSEKLFVTALHCENCGTSLTGRFMPDTGCAVSQDAEGNIKQVERLMNCSYPKVKNLLKRAKEELHLGQGGDGLSQEEKTEVLEQLDKGEITFEEAMKKLEE